LRRERDCVEADLMADPSSREIVRRDVDAAPQTRLTRFVRGVEVRRPLEPHVGRRPFLEREERVLRRDELGEPAREVRGPGEARQYLRGRTTEGAVPRDEPGKRRRDEGASLVGAPVDGANPTHA